MHIRTASSSQQDMLFSKAGWRALRKFQTGFVLERKCVFRTTMTLHKGISPHSHCIRHVAYFKSIVMCVMISPAQEELHIQIDVRDILNALTLKMDYLRVTYMCLLHVMDCFHSLDAQSQNCRQLWHPSNHLRCLKSQVKSSSRNAQHVLHVFIKIRNPESILR